MNSGGLLRDAGEGGRNTFTAGNGHHLGVPPGRGKGRETGIYRRCLEPAGGVWRRGVRETGRTGSPENLGNRANRDSEAGRPVDLDRGGWETSRSGTVRPGDWRIRSREAGKLADPGPQPDKAPFISYMKGALLHCAARRIPVTRDTPASRGHDEHFAADGDAGNAASPVTVAAAADIGAWGRLMIRTLKSRLSTVYP